jgi:hypothetical protein
MNVPTLTMPVEEAKVAYREYRKHLGPNPDRRDTAVLMGYRDLAKGRGILDLHEAFRKTGIDEAGRPRLVIGRADWAHAHFRRMGSDEVQFTADGNWPRRQAPSPFTAVVLPVGVLPTLPWNRTPCPVSHARAMTPLIPPRLRPEGELSRYHILWEAVWENMPPVDPLLLRHLTGRLYAVLATWDLTSLERLVLGAVPAQDV